MGSLVLYTLPFLVHDLDLPSSLAKNPIFRDHYASQVTKLSIYPVLIEMSEIFSILSKSRRLRYLSLSIDADRLLSNF